MKDKDSWILLLLLLAWIWFISPKKGKTTTTASTVPPGFGTTSDTLGSQVEGGVDLSTAILNLGSTQTANLINSIGSTSGAGTAGTGGVSNLPGTQGGYAPINLQGTAGTADNQPVSVGQPGYTPINSNTQPQPIAIVFQPSGPSDPWPGGYDHITYQDNSIDIVPHSVGQFSAKLYQPLLDSTGNVIPEVVPGVGQVG